MSALARYFLHAGKAVAGYDRTETALTRALAAEGAEVCYAEDEAQIPVEFRDPAKTLVVYTPAVPDDHAGLRWFREHGFEMVKRSRMLGYIATGKYVMAVAGSHGKTTTTTLAAWLNQEAAAQGKESEEGTGSAFLGGISKNFGSNLVLGTGCRLAVEADEFDRSFLQLHPDAAVITAVDADHLDIYGTHEAMKEAFAQFVRQIRPGGTLILKQGADLVIDNDRINVRHYAYDTPCDFYAANITFNEGGYYRFDLHCPDRVIADCTLGIPGWVNVENAVAAVALLWTAGFDEVRLRDALARFEGVKRRFEFYLNTPQQVYMDDYAHHPEELRAAITSVRGIFPGRRLTAVFQPHLYTRTRDFHREFAAALSLADEVVLVPIYPAREEPIPGVESTLIGRNVQAPWRLVEKEKIASELALMETEVVVTFGAGDIENYCAEIAEVLRGKAG